MNVLISGPAHLNQIMMLSTIETMTDALIQLKILAEAADPRPNEMLMNGIHSLSENLQHVSDSVSQVR